MMMRFSKLMGVMLAGVVLSQVAMAAFAEDGPWTSGNNIAWSAGSVPLRVITGSVGMAGGTVIGGTKGAVELAQDWSGKTFGKMGENPLKGLAGLIAVPVALPLGFVKGAPGHAMEVGKESYDWWNRY
jgi:hypothetical protein